MEKQQSEALLRPFDKSQIQQLPKGGMKLDFVSHGNVTRRLLEVDPDWNWEPMAYDVTGLPLFDERGGLWIKLTVCGVTRIGYGEPQGSDQYDRTKGAIGNAIRVAAMRFGVALDLWAKEDSTPVTYRDVSPDYEPKITKAVNGLPLPTPPMSKKQSDFILKLVGPNIHLIDEWKKSKSIKGTLNVAQATELIDHLKVNVPLMDPWANDIPKGGNDE